MSTLTPNPLSLKYGEGRRIQIFIPFSLLKGEG